MSFATECLATSEGALVSISIAVEPQRLESLLEALALLEFPVNPGIFHDAAIITRHADGREDTEPITLVEFPAYSGRVDEVRLSLEQHGFGAACLQVTPMLEDLQDEPARVNSGDGSVRYRVRRHTAV